MITRRSFLSLIGLGSVAAAIAPKLKAEPPLIATARGKTWTTTFPEPDRKFTIYNFNEPAPKGCALTQASIRRLTPAELTAMHAQETRRPGFIPIVTYGTKPGEFLKVYEGMRILTG